MLTLPSRLRRLLAPATVMLVAVMLATVMLATADAQIQVGAVSSNQSSSNPNRISNQSRGSGDVGDLFGTQSFWVGYDIPIGSDYTLTPAYSLGLTLWGSQSEQNFLQHDFSLFFKRDNLFLLSHPPAPDSVMAGMVDLMALAGADPRKDSLVARMYDIAGDLNDAPLVSQHAESALHATASPDTSAEMDDPESDDEDDWWLGDDDSLDESTLSNADSLRTAVVQEILAGDDDLGLDEADSLLAEEEPPAPLVAVTGEAMAISADSLRSGLVEALLSTADSLDIEEGTADLIEATAGRIRRIQGALRMALPDQAVTPRVNAGLDSILARLAAYVPPDADTSAPADTDQSFLFAPVSLGFQPLIRNTMRNYGFTTVPSDAGGNQLQFSGDLATGNYLSGDTALERYESTYISGSLLLEQQLSPKVDFWGKLSLSHESYPSDPLFNNTQTIATAGLHILPSERLTLAFDLTYGVKSYQEDLSVPGLAGKGKKGGNVAVDSAASTSLLDLGVGLFYRPLPSTMLGVALSHQSTPAQHPRLLITTSSGQARGGGDVLSSRSTNISDDIFSWNGNDLQLIVMQELPLELVATAYYDHSSRDYGQMTATVNGRTAKLQNRTDTRGTFGLSLSRDFFFGESSLHYLSVGLSYGSVNNSSTNFTRRAIPVGDYDFNFSEKYVALNVQWAVY